MAWRSWLVRGGLAAGAWAALLAAGPAAAQPAPRSRVEVKIVVTHASRRPGPIEPEARELHKRLHKQFRYESLRVLERRDVRLQIDEIGGMRLPNGRWVRLRPLSLHPDGVLMAVQVEGSLQTDLRMRSRRMVVLGGQPYEDGWLVISLEPSF